MRLTRSALFAAALLGLSAQAFALVDVRVGLGSQFVDPEEFNRTYTALSPELEMDNIFSFTLDATVRMPVIPLGVGVRLESGGSDAETTLTGNNTVTWDISTLRYSVVGSLRLLDTLVYVGPIVTLGYHSGELETTAGGLTGKADLEADGPSASLGAEAGVNLGNWTLGGELGYIHMKYKETSQVGTALDLSGGYFKLLFGRKF